FNSMIVASVSTVLFNANPLLRYDGYYILSDLLEIPNLQQKSTEYTMGLIKRHIFRVKLQKPLPPFGQRIWLFIYAICSTIYRVFIGIMIILLVYFKVPVLGVIMAMGGVVTWMVLPIVKNTRYILLHPEPQRKRGRAAAFTLGVIGAIIIGIGVVPVWVHYEAMGVVEAQNREILKARTPGFVTELGTHPDGRPILNGDFVHAGQVILVSTNEKLEAELDRLRNQIRQAEVRINRDRAADPAQMLIDQDELRFLQGQLQQKQKDYDDLTIRAPFDGWLVAPRLSDLPGRYLERGNEIAMVATLDTLVVRTLIDQKDGQ